MNISIKNCFNVLAILLSSFLFSTAVFSTDIDLSDEPLAIKTEGTPPNVMLLFDDSTSMTCWWGNCGDDIVYSPGYDSEKDYSCSGGETVIAPVDGQEIVVHISMTPGYEGTPYFSYNGVEYGWGVLTGAITNSTPEVYSNQNLNRVCFDSSKKYRVKLKADQAYVTSGSPYIPAIPEQPSIRLVASGEWYCADPSAPYGVHERHTPVFRSSRQVGGRTTYYNVWVCNDGASKWWRYFATQATSDIWTDYVPYSPAVPAVDAVTHYLYSTATAQEETGNYLNWYFSATIAEWADASSDGGYKDYGDIFPNHSYWTEEVASDFIYEETWYQGADPATTVINGTTTNTNGKTWFPDDPPPDEWYDHESSSSQHAANEHNLMGLKPSVYEYQSREMVAKDVAKMLTRKLDHANLGVAALHTPVATDYSSPTQAEMGALYGLDGGSLVHGLVEIDTVSQDATVQAQTATRQASLAKAIDAIKSIGSTPTSEAMSAIASYMFQTYETEDSPIGASNQTLGGSLPSSLLLHSAAPSVNTSVPNITSDNWCAKNITVVLTDGEPTLDTEYPSDFRTEYPSGLPNPSTPPVESHDSSDAYNKSGIVRVPGALYDYDWLPNIKGKQNIESFFIAMGDSSVINDPIFDLAGMAGGGGKNNSYAANNGADLVNAFNDIIEKVNASSASVTSVAISTVSELKTENLAFQATYDTTYWTSLIKAININADGNFVNPDDTGASDSSENIIPEWEASNILNSMYLLNDNNISGDDVSGNYISGGVKKRHIYTWNGTSAVQFGSTSMTRPTSANATFAEFNILPQAMRDDLDVLAAGDSRERYDLMMYLLGDAKDEVGYPYPATGGSEKYRQRGRFTDVDSDGLIDGVLAGGLFGDVVHSSPVYVEDPPRPWDDANFGLSGKRYSDFIAEQETRAAMVYVGGNDGMVHGITVDSGSKNSISYPAGGELFAYMPSMLASTNTTAGFHYLADPDYTHRYYVDLTLTPSDVFVDFYSGALAVKDPEWRTILVGGLRGGGKGLFALDITCPYQLAGSTCSNESFSATNILWEFDSTDDADLGYTFSEPVIAKVNYDSGFATASERNGNGSGRWAAIVGNGYNSTNGRAVLYILFLDGGIDGTWTQGVDYLKVYVSDSTTDNSSNKNGLSSPQAVDINNDGLVDRVYVGDLKGQMWSININGAASKAQYDANTIPWVANKLFTTGSQAGTVQPITTPPMVARDGAVTAPLPNLMVVFATGKYLEESDLYDTSVQTVYGVHDRGVYNLTRYDNTADGSKTLLEPRIFSEQSFTANGETLNNRTVTGNNVDPATQFGWYAELASDVDNDGAITSSELLGERVVFNPFLANKLFVFNSIIPVVGSCSGATQGWTMLVDWTTGLAPSFATYDANLTGNLDPLDIGYIGFFNDAAGSQLGRGGDNIYDSSGNEARRLGVDFGSLSSGQRLGWEERFPFGVIR